MRPAAAEPHCQDQLWLATVLVAAALAFPYIAPTLLGT